MGMDTWFMTDAEREEDLRLSKNIEKARKERDALRAFNARLEPLRAKWGDLPAGKLIAIERESRVLLSQYRAKWGDLPDEELIKRECLEDLRARYGNKPDHELYLQFLIEQTGEGSGNPRVQ